MVRSRRYRRRRTYKKKPEAKVPGWAPAVAYFFTLAGAVAFGILGTQPWMGFGYWFLGSLTEIPFEGVLSRLWIIGDVIAWFHGIGTGTLASLIAVSVCCFINFLQVMGGVNKDNHGLRLARLAGTIVELCVSWVYYTPYAGGFTALWEDFPYIDPDLVEFWSLIGMILSVVAFENWLNYGLLFRSELIKKLQEQRGASEGEQKTSEDEQSEQQSTAAA